jgi:transcriptional regulator with XRE-family HTH domain
MALSDRMRIIVNECGLKQKAFAQSINVTDSYISKLMRDESGMANSTALLIEQLYGYSKEWIITGKEPKMLTGRGRNVTGLQRKIIMDVEQMNEDELRAVLAFIESLRKSVVRPYRERKAR